MKSRAKNLTADQRVHWDSILKRKQKYKIPEKSKTLSDVLKEQYGNKILDKEIYYLGNCIFWLKEYNEGRTDKKRVLETLSAIVGLWQDIKNKLDYNQNLKIK